jgi:nuclear transport factor 2 (NTF2) superfamily protein
MPQLTPGDGQDLLTAWKRGWEGRNPDAIVDLFDDDAEYRQAPFTDPLKGVNAIRELWNGLAASQANVEFDAEHVWVSGATVLASWHAAYTRRDAGGERVRAYGFMTAELNDAGKVWRMRLWPVEHVVGRDSTFKAEVDG